MHPRFSDVNLGVFMMLASEKFSQKTVYKLGHLYLRRRHYWKKNA